MRKQMKFTISFLLALLWLSLSAAISAGWIRYVGNFLPGWYVAWVICGIALLPGFLTGEMFFSNLANTRLEPIACEAVGPICVIICARNEEGTIYKTIERVVMQKYDGNIRILCVDNASTDRTDEEIEWAKQVLSRANRSIERIVCKALGKSHALNAGLARVDTQYFLTVDADTLLHENAVCAILSRISQTGAGCVAGNLQVERPRTWVQKMQIYDYLISIAAIKRYQGTYSATLVAQGAFSVYDTAAVQAVGGWTHDSGEDIVLTYRLLSMGHASLYEPQAIGLTVVPSTLWDFYRQRVRWAQGMFEGFMAVKPWMQTSFASGYFQAINLSIVYLDLAYVFGFLVGVVLMIFGYSWFVGWMALLLLMIPLLCIHSTSIYFFQRRVSGKVVHSALGLVCFLLLFQSIQSLCSLVGYGRMIAQRRVIWK